MVDCFWAFSDEQIAEGLKKHNLSKEDIHAGGSGLYGTADGMKSFLAGYEDIRKKISTECTPQEVYDSEFWNHECDYVGDDSEALVMVQYYFGDERIKEVQRRL